MKRITKVLIVLLVLALLGVGVYFFVFKNKDNKKVEEAKVVNTISGYDYKLYDNASKLYKDNFAELKKVLESENIDEEEYVKLISTLFVADFFTLDNKVTNDDIGGVSFVHKDAIDNFKLKAKDTVYKYIESNIYGDRKQELPIVDKITNLKVEKTTVSYKTINDQKAYKVNISWEYKKDLGYIKEKTLIFVHEDKVLSLIEMK